AMAARVAGLDCQLIFPGARAAPTLNQQLARAAGAQLRFEPGTTRDQLDDLVQAQADVLRKQDRRPYPVPRGGATAVGAVGYADAAEELHTQCAAVGIRPRVV